MSFCAFHSVHCCDKQIVENLLCLDKPPFVMVDPAKLQLYFTHFRL